MRDPERLFRSEKLNPLAPRGYCEECGAALIDVGIKEVAPLHGKFDTQTGERKPTELWRIWECPNKAFVQGRGWVHSTYTDYDVKAG